MYQTKFGSKNQIQFDSAAEYYEFLGYLAKDDGTTKLVWENNDERGAWAAEGRIQFYVEQPAALRARLNHTAGTGNITSRVNCNDFLKHIAKFNHFRFDGSLDKSKICASIPIAHVEDFERGLGL